MNPQSENLKLQTDEKIPLDRTVLYATEQHNLVSTVNTSNGQEIEVTHNPTAVPLNNESYIDSQPQPIQTAQSNNTVFEFQDEGEGEGEGENESEKEYESEPEPQKQQKHREEMLCSLNMPQTVLENIDNYKSKKRSKKPRSRGLRQDIGLIEETDTKPKRKRKRKLIYVNGWSRANIRVIRYYVNFLSYMALVYHFYYFKLKKIEGYWSWAIIVFSSLASALSLFQYHEENPILDLSVKITITIFSLIITLISAWIKKQNYVERISEIGKYSIKISKLKNTVKSILEEPIDTRMKYDKFAYQYKNNIVEFISNRPLISPYEWKETVFIISKYYPELAAYEFPWNKVENFGLHTMDTFKKLKYSTCWNKIKHCYFCKSKCFCKNSDEDKKRSHSIMSDDINFYQNLPKQDIDYNPYQPKKVFLENENKEYNTRIYSDSNFGDIYIESTESEKEKEKEPPKNEISRPTTTIYYQEPLRNGNPYDDLPVPDVNQTFMPQQENIIPRNFDYHRTIPRSMPIPRSRPRIRRFSYDYPNPNPNQIHPRFQGITQPHFYPQAQSYPDMRIHPRAGEEAAENVERNLHEQIEIEIPIDGPVSYV